MNNEVKSLAADWTYLTLLREAATCMSSLSREAVQPLDLTLPQTIALLLMRQRPGMKQSSLGQAMQSDPNTISGVVRRLESRGLIIRKRRSADERSVELVVTSEGEELAGRAQESFDHLASLLNETVPRRGAKTIIAWLRTVASLRNT